MKASNKNLARFVTLVLAVIIACLVFVSCNNAGSQNLRVLSASINDEGNLIAVLSNGETVDAGVINVEGGKDGINGETPYIGENGNWWIGETDLGVKAQGNDGSVGAPGEKGEPGKDGAPGKDGKTPYIGENGNWWIGDEDTDIKAEGTDGEDGKTPHIGENGNWWISLKDDRLNRN